MAPASRTFRPIRSGHRRRRRPRPRYRPRARRQRLCRFRYGHVICREVQDLKEASGGRVSLTVCDITKEQAVKAWAGGVSDALGIAAWIS